MFSPRNLPKVPPVLEFAVPEYETVEEVCTGVKHTGNGHSAALGENVGAIALAHALVVFIDRRAEIVQVVGLVYWVGVDVVGGQVLLYAVERGCWDFGVLGRGRSEHLVRGRSEHSFRCC